MPDTDAQEVNRRRFLPKTAMVYELLREQIADGTWEPGERLLEVELVKRFEVSRTPIREALVRLEQDGLVTRHGTAVYVRHRSPDEVLDIYAVRVLIEGSIARSAALRRVTTDLLRLEAAMTRCASVDTSDPLLLQQANREFHNALTMAARNPTLEDIQGRLTAQVMRLPSTTLSYPGRWERALQEHAAIVEAVRAQDGDEAERLARAHMQDAADIRLRLMAKEFAAE